MVMMPTFAAGFVILAILITAPAELEQAKATMLKHAAPHKGGREWAVMHWPPMTRIKIHHEVTKLFLITFNFDAESLIGFDNAKFL